MTQEVIRSLDETLLCRMVFAISPARIVPELARLDRRVYFRYFKGYRPDKISRKKVLAAVRTEIVDGDDERFAELVVLGWNAAHWELYEAMRKNVAKINPDVEAIERIEDDQAAAIVADLSSRFEREDIYLCSMLNEVRFSPEFKAKLDPTAEVADEPSGEAAAEPGEAPEAEAEAAPEAEAEAAPEAEGSPSPEPAE